MTSLICVLRSSRVWFNASLCSGISSRFSVASLSWLAGRAWNLTTSRKLAMCEATSPAMSGKGFGSLATGVAGSVPLSIVFSHSQFRSTGTGVCSVSGTYGDALKNAIVVSIDSTTGGTVGHGVSVWSSARGCRERGRPSGCSGVGL
jgi:hypothetical protein